MVDEKAAGEGVLRLMRSNPGSTTRQLAAKGRLDLPWLRDRLLVLVKDGRALCTGGRWFVRGAK